MMQLMILRFSCSNGGSRGGYIGGTSITIIDQSTTTTSTLGATIMVILGPSFNDFRPLEILLPTGISKRENVGDLLGLHMKDMGMSLKETSKEETPQNLTPKFVEEMVEDVL